MEKMQGKGLKKLGRVLLRFIVSYGPLVILSTPNVYAEGTTIDKLTSDISANVAAIGGLIIAMACALFAAGLVFTFVPWASQKMKETGRFLLDHALILAGLAALGIFLLAFASQIAVGIVGRGTPFEPSGAWQVPTS